MSATLGHAPLTSGPMASTPKHEGCEQDRPLAQAIAVATRSVHTELNKLIIARLPLALPPRAVDPTFYVTGLLHVANIYITFESLWRTILDHPPVNLDDDDDRASVGSSSPAISRPHSPHSGSHDTPHGESEQTASPQPAPRANDRLHGSLQHLFLPALMRGDALKEEICQLTGWSQETLQEQLSQVAQTGPLADFLQHITRAVTQKPHVLVAYSYILFMALFAGGRIIRGFLESAGDEFWDTKPSPVKPTLQPCYNTAAPNATEGLRGATPLTSKADDNHSHHRSDGAPRFQFFRFSTPLDGEDLKFEYKSRLTDLEKDLTPREKRHIVQESVCIFDNMRLIVRQLDMACTGLDREEIDEDVKADSEGTAARSSRGRFRDSVAVTKARHARASSKRSSSGESDSDVSTVPTSDDDSESTKSHDGQAAEARSRMASKSHSLLHGVANVHLCPAMSKSMRFDKALPSPLRQVQDQHSDDGILKGAMSYLGKLLPKVPPTSMVIGVMFGAVILGTVLSGRRS